MESKYGVQFRYLSEWLKSFSVCLHPLYTRESLLLAPQQIILVKHFVPFTCSSVHQTSCQSNQMKLEMFEDLRESIFLSVSLYPKFPSSPGSYSTPLEFHFPGSCTHSVSQILFWPFFSSCDQNDVPHFEFKVLHRQTVCSFIYSIRILYTTCLWRECGDKMCSG